MDARRILIMAALVMTLPGPASAKTGDEDPPGPAAIAKAHRLALATSPRDRLIGGEQVFHFAEGRLYEVWTSPLRVTTLTLGVGENVISLAAGDSVRWQIAQTMSGSGAQARAHVLIKPFERGLSTNLVISTDKRVYVLVLRSGEVFNAVVSWTPEPPDAPAPGPAPRPAPPDREPQMLATRFAISPHGRPPAWTPSAVMTDGRRTYILMPPQVGTGEGPVLNLIDQDGTRVLANYRQKGALLIVDGVIGLAELRLGSQRAQVVRITRLPEERP